MPVTLWSLKTWHSLECYGIVTLPSACHTEAYILSALQQAKPHLCYARLDLSLCRLHAISEVYQFLKGFDKACEAF